ncbi:glycoside hydrolase family 73 protein [Oceanirhabdus seepicola]|uniref:Glucosaminidase domain-containing protein n=1 Tax=Oceanirhabdus seepicola TaxID=2828781 RepID=A0A9J6PAV2_9CLOT|nr:glucosaminidase domain-containing protein [Oceanirhabdus seepicola]MCM1992785.1 glucosaminidase domain-containing protein [Oceanirhabdus seepicola]
MCFKSKVISLLLPYAKKIDEKYSLLPSVTIAQVILETGWLKYCKGNNLFGIKRTRKSGFEYEELQTYEWINGVKTPMMCLFRKYNSYEDSFDDYAELLSKASRYIPVINSKDYYEGCHNLYTCGYCTDPDYPNKLIYN